MTIKWPKLITKLTPFTKWLNAILSNCMAITPKSTGDITVQHTTEGSFFYLNPKWKTDGLLHYFFKSRYGEPNNKFESVQDRASRMATYTASYGIDAQVWNARTELDGYNVGDIVRVLPYTNPSHVDLYSKFTTADISGSNLWGTECIYPNGLVSRPGTYICVAAVPQSSTNWLNVSQSNFAHTARNPKICYSPLFPEPVINADIFGPYERSGSKFQNYQGRYWECIGLLTAPTSSATPWFKGEWSAASTYNVGEGVVVQSGANAGGYICVTSTTGSQTGSAFQPTNGSPYWILFGSGPTRGEWT